VVLYDDEVFFIDWMVFQQLKKKRVYLEGCEVPIHGRMLDHHEQGFNDVI
jgi:hypothetical protein